MFYINNELETEKRFDTIKFFNFNSDNVDPLSSFFMLNIENLPEQGTYILDRDEKRPDLIAYRLYSDTQYWWILLIYNHILDINDLVIGTELKYPSKSAIEYLYERACILGKTI